MNRRNACLALACLPLPPLAARAAAPPGPTGLSGLVASNVVPISDRLVTSGQPTAEALAGLGALGFGAVIYLAPPTVSDAVPGEADIVRRQGLQFANVPIPFDAPTLAHFDSFRERMAAWQAHKRLVHCQINLRASTLVFLQRVVDGGEPPGPAYEAVSRVWSPQGPWRALVLAALKRHGVAFEPY